MRVLEDVENLHTKLPLPVESLSLQVRQARESSLASLLSAASLTVSGFQLIALILVNWFA